MKNAICVFGILIVFSTSIQAQSDLEEALKYYPLESGNYWEYMSIEDNLVFGIDTSYYSIEVLSDTLMSNGEKYKILKKNYFNSDYSSECFQRIDSLTANVYEYSGYEYLIDSLFSKVNDISIAGRGFQRFSKTKCIQISTDTLFNLSFETKLFKNIKEPIGFEYKLAKGLGYIGEEICEGTCYWEVLVYAKIGDKVYGQSVTTIDEYRKSIQKSFILYQNYPNPFNPSTIIKFKLGKSAITTLVVYDSQGKLMSELVNEYKNQGIHLITFDASDLSSGIYFYRLKAASFIQTQKMLLIQ